MKARTNGKQLHYGLTYRYEITEFWDYSLNLVRVNEGSKEFGYGSPPRDINLSDFWSLTVGAYRLRSVGLPQ